MRNTILKAIIILYKNEKLTRRSLITQWGASEQTYDTWIPKLEEMGIIKTEQENNFPFSKHHILTEKGKKIAQKIEELVELFLED